MSLLARAGVGVDRPSTGRHPIELLTSTCTDVAVRTHVPVKVGLQVVLVPIAGADEVMRAIARAVWPDDPSPLEEQEYVAGVAASRLDEAVQILQSFREDDEARQEAFKALTGTDLLVQFGEASCARS
jgi:hypothetical protein